MKPNEVEFMDGFEEIQELGLMTDFKKICKELGGGRFPAEDLRSRNRGIVSKLCADFAPWWIVCPMEPAGNESKSSSRN